MALPRTLHMLLLVCACTCAVLPSAARAELRVVFGYSSFFTPAILELNAGAVQLSAHDQGWFDEFGNRAPSEGNYIAGVCGLPYDYCGNSHDVVYRDFFAFNLAGVTPQVASASLLLWNPAKFDVSGDGYTSSRATETFLLHEVHTSTAELAAINSHRVDVFDDLGDGTFYGDQVMSAADNGTWVRVPLNAAALAAINDAAGSGIVFGGSLANVGAVPEPQTIVLMLGGLGWLTWTARRRQVKPAA
jgi:hypothetical protein